MLYLCPHMAQKDSSWGYTLKKSLGQHFLRDETVCHRIVAQLETQNISRLLEVGPGGGALTKHLLPLPNVHLLAVEVDDEKVAYLQKKYPALAGRLLHASILDIDPPFDAPFYVTGNFPYNISTEIVFKLLEWRPLLLGMTGMFQKEVAQRLAAPPGSKVYGVTSVLVQAYFEVTYLFDVPPEAFDPPPKVMSGVMCMLPRTAQDVPPMRSEAHFKRLVKAAFQQRRKQLRNAVKGLFMPEVLAQPIFSQRAEQLSVAQFAELTFSMT